MPDAEKINSPTEEAHSSASQEPQVFISHDGRDAELAEAFSKLIKSVSAGVIKTFRSSDKKGNEGIDFGDEWYKRLMTKLQSTTDVVCLFTERSLDRPWILFEAGVAKGKMNTPVVGVALGISLARISTGPFYQFQNMTDSEDDLKKLVDQLARPIPRIELDSDVVKNQIATFKKFEQEILSKLSKNDIKNDKETIEEIPIAKIVEDMKALPSRVAERLSDYVDPARRRRMKRFNPMILEEMLYVYERNNNPLSILLLAGSIRDDAPWLYEIMMDIYRAVKSEDLSIIMNEAKHLRNVSDFIMSNRFREMYDFDKDTYLFISEFPRILEKSLKRSYDEKKSQTSQKISKKKLNIDEDSDL